MSHPNELLLVDVLDGHAHRTPDGISVRCGDTSLTWEALAERVARLVGVLETAGVRRGDRVAWLAQNCHRYLEAMLACGALGAVFAPLNWRQSTSELRWTLEDLEPTLVLWQADELDAKVAELRPSADGTSSWLQVDADPGDTTGYEGRVAGAPRATVGDATRPTPSDPVLLLYTAAFDGRPSGALLTHHGLLVQAGYGIQYAGVTAEDIYLNAGPLFHVGTLKTTLATYVAGGVNVFVRRVEPEELCRTIADHRCTGAFLQPPTMAAMVEANRDLRYDLRSLCSKPGPPGWDDMTTTATAARYRSGFGQTELGGVVTFVDRERPSVGTAGWPAPHCDVTVLQPDGARAERGEIGELAVRGPVVMHSYHQRPELTATRHAGGWHRTGDLGRIEVDGSVSFVGPAVRLIKSAAENVYPAEVEACLAAHPDVADVAVLGVPDPAWGQSVAAVVVPRVGRSPIAEDLIEHCRAHIASYKKPRVITYAESLPRHGGQLDRDAIDAAYGGGGYPSSG